MGPVSVSIAATTASSDVCSRPSDELHGPVFVTGAVRAELDVARNGDVRAHLVLSGPAATAVPAILIPATVSTNVIPVCISAATPI